MSSFTPIVPPGQHPPYSVVTPTDHGAWIIISASLWLSITLLFAGIRIFIRSSTNPGYGKDDYSIACASVSDHDHSLNLEYSWTGLYVELGRHPVECAAQRLRRRLRKISGAA